MSLTAGSAVLQARLPRGAGLWPVLALLLGYSLAAAPPLKDQPHIRRPVAAAWIEPGKLLAVANSRSGSVSIVDIPGHKVLAETAVGEKLADIVARPSGGRLLAVDESRHELMLLEGDRDVVRVISRTPVSPFPVSIAISSDGGRIAVASLWSRKLTIFEPNIDLPGAGVLRLLATIDLPFNPRRLLFLPDNVHLIVADSFAGGLAVVDGNQCKLVVRHEIDGHNLRGLALSADGKELVVAHQQLSQRIANTMDNMMSGKLTNIGIKRLSVEQLLDRMSCRFSEPLPAKESWDLRAAADPSDVIAGGANRIAAAFSGTADVQLGALSRSVATAPRRLVLEGNTLIAVCEFSDSLVLILADGTVEEIKLGPVPDLSPADRGERRFYSSMWYGHWMSCHSCHTDGHTSGLLADTLGDGTEGTPKRIPTLLGTRLTDPWAWNGQVRSLNDQVRKSLETTMHAGDATPQQVDDITAYLHTLSPPPPLEPAIEDPADRAQLARGQSLFKTLGCAKCHVPPLTYTSSDAYDVGLEDEQGLKKYNPPSLRGVSQGYSFFHDGRAKKLEEVFTVHGHQLSRALEKDELADLLRFLRSL